MTQSSSKFCILLMFLACACAGKHVSAGDSTPYQVLPTASDELGKGTERRMVIRQGAVTVIVDSVSNASGKVQALIPKMGGFIVNATEEEGSAAIKARVPAARLEEAINEIAKLGDEDSRRLTSEDVTDNYIDLEAKFKNTVALRDRIRELLKQTHGIKEVLDLETQLARVQADADSLEGQLKHIRADVSLSQLDIVLKRETKLGPLGWIGAKIGWLFAKLFVIQ